MTWRGIRGGKGTGRCCWSSWTGSIGSRLRRGWWGRMGRRRGDILSEGIFFGVLGCGMA